MADNRAFADAHDDRYTDWDGAYVLGALDPAERAEYERHLQQCPRCATAVAEMAGLPGLLSRVPVERVLADSEPPPVSLLPRLARSARRDRRRRLVLAAVAAVMVACLAVTGGYAWSASRTERSAPVAQRQMSVLVPAPVYATAGLQSVGWGTRVFMNCTHESTPGQAYKPGWYVMFVVPKRGTPEQVASWTSEPGKTARIEGDTWYQAGQIQAIEVRGSDGTTVLRLVT